MFTKKSRVAQAGYEANVPLLVQAGKAARDEHSYIHTNCDNIVIDTVKKSEDGEEIVLRIFETYNTVNDVVLTMGFPVHSGANTDLQGRHVA